MSATLDWQPYFDIAERDIPYREKLAGYAAIARDRLQAAEFEAFCAEHIPHLDQCVWEFFDSEVAFDAVRQKVASLYPEHEVEEFTKLFWNRIQRWRDESMPSPAGTVER